MHRTYEAVYEKGHLRWLGNRPPSQGRHRALVTLLEEEPAPHDRAEVRRMLEETRGAWGTSKSLEEVSIEAQRLREEWDRLDHN